LSHWILALVAGSWVVIATIGLGLQAAGDHPFVPWSHLAMFAVAVSTLAAVKVGLDRVQRERIAELAVSVAQTRADVGTVNTALKTVVDDYGVALVRLAGKLTDVGERLAELEKFVALGDAAQVENHQPGGDIHPATLAAVRRLRRRNSGDH